MIDDDDEAMARAKAAVNLQVTALVQAGSPGQTRRLYQERVPRVLRADRVVQRELDPVWDLGEIVVSSVGLQAGEFTEGTLEARMGISSLGELLSIEHALERTTHYDFASVAEAHKALEALRAIARTYGVRDVSPDEYTGPE